MDISTWLILSLTLPVIWAQCPALDQSHARNQTRLQARLALQNALSRRCGIPTSIPPIDLMEPWKKWHVALSFQPLQVVTVDEIEQSVTLSSYLIIKWTDSSLAWDPALYDGIHTVQMARKDIWSPKIIVPKTTQSQGIELQLPDKVSVTYEGTVLAPSPNFVSTLCALDMRNFPFDSHTCSIVFLEQEVFLNMTVFEANKSDVKEYFGTNAGWLVGEVGCHDMNSTSTQFPKMTYVVCQVNLKRRSAFYVINLIGPMAMTSVMTLIVFWIPPEEREKVSFVTSVFMSTSLYLGFILDRLPRSMDSVPYLNLLLMAIVAEVILATIATAYVLQRCRKHLMMRQNQRLQLQARGRALLQGLDAESFLNDQNAFKSPVNTNFNKTAWQNVQECSPESYDFEMYGKTHCQANIHAESDGSVLSTPSENEEDRCSAFTNSFNIRRLCFGAKSDQTPNNKRVCDKANDQHTLALGDKLSQFSKLPRVVLRPTDPNSTCETGKKLNTMSNEENESVNYFSYSGWGQKSPAQSLNTWPSIETLHTQGSSTVEELPEKMFIHTFNKSAMDDPTLAGIGHHDTSPIPDIHSIYTNQYREEPTSPLRLAGARCLSDAQRQDCNIRCSHDGCEQGGLTPEDLDKVFFWAMSFLIVVTWLLFFIPVW